MLQRFPFIMATTALFSLTLSAGYAGANNPTQLKANIPTDQSTVKTWEKTESEDDADEVQEDEIIISGDNLRDLITNNPSLKTLAKALLDTDLIGTLSESGPVTIFAPNNAAFNKLSPEKRDEMMGNREKLKQILKYHILTKKVSPESANGSQRTVNGKDISIKASQGKVNAVNNAKVLQQFPAVNGFIYEIDTVLIPQ